MRLTVPLVLIASTALAIVECARIARTQPLNKRNNDGVSEAHLRHRRQVMALEQSHDDLLQRSLNRRQDSVHGSTEQSAAQVKDPTQECSPYGLPEVTAMLADFPAIWQTADILANDQRALQFMQAINSSGIIPTDLQPRGQGIAGVSTTGQGITSGYNTAQDPDCYWTATGCVSPKHSGLLPDISTCDEPHTWGYTIDDGPNCTHNAFYDFWQQNNQKATLFYIGSNAMDWPLEAQRGVTDGHMVCVHTWSHKYMTSLTTDQAFAELYYTQLALKRLLGITPTCWRPPFGDVDDRIRAIAQSLGLRTVIWQADTNDFFVQPGGPSPTASIQANYNSIISKGASPAAETGGVIVLQHELTNGTMQLGLENYAAVKKAWPNLVPLNACLNLTQPYAEDIVFPNFAQYVGGTTMASGLPTNSIAIDTAAAVTPQGTLSGMGGKMPTAAAGGPDNGSSSGAKSGSGGGSSSGSGSGGKNSSSGNQKSGAIRLSASLGSSTFSATAVLLSFVLGAAFLAHRV